MTEAEKKAKEAEAKRIAAEKAEKEAKAIAEKKAKEEATAKEAEAKRIADEKDAAHLAEKKEWEKAWHAREAEFEKELETAREEDNTIPITRDLRLRDVQPEGEHLRENVACPRCRGNSVIDTDVDNDCLIQTCLDSDPEDPHTTILGKAWAGRLDKLPAFNVEEAPSPFEEAPQFVTDCPRCGAEAAVTDPGKKEALLASCKNDHAFKLARSWLKRLKAPV